MADTEYAQAFGCVQLLHRAGLSTDVGLAMTEMLQVCKVSTANRNQESNAMPLYTIISPAWPADVVGCVRLGSQHIICVQWRFQHTIGIFVHGGSRASLLPSVSSDFLCSRSSPQTVRCCHAGRQQQRCQEAGKEQIPCKGRGQQGLLGVINAESMQRWVSISC